MNFESPLYEGTLIRRYKRFLADVQLDNGEQVTAHTANSGSMKSCSEAGRRVRLSKSNNPKRKLKYTWEMIDMGSSWVGVNTQLPNLLAADAIAAGHIPELQGYADLKREVPFGQEKSRVDILLSDGDRRCYVEVKNVSMLADDGAVAFPDAVTLRGQKHLRELISVAHEGHGAALLFVVQRTDGNLFRPADEIDPAYGTLLREAAKKKVQILAYEAPPDPKTIVIGDAVPVCLD